MASDLMTSPMRQCCGKPKRCQPASSWMPVTPFSEFTSLGPGQRSVQILHLGAADVAAECCR